jgi:hypothetical protein
MTELVAAHQQLAAGSAVALRPLLISYADYLRALHAHCNTAGFLAEQRAFWLDPCRLRRAVPLPRDLAGQKHMAAHTRVHRTVLSAKQLDAMSAYIAANQQLSLQDLLIYGLVRAYGRWTGGQPLHMDIEHSGRTAVLPEIELWHTLGPMTVKVPFWFETDPSSPKETMLRATRQVLRETMSHALGHGYLRWQRPDAEAAARLAECEVPELFFNNRSSMQLASLPEASPIEAEPEWMPDPETHLITYLILFACDRVSDSFELSVEYSSAIHHDSTIKNLVDTMLDEIDLLIGRSEPTS